MPGEIAIYLLGAQGGVADDFARLHAVTNPVLLRYLRVTADGDHEELARTAWTAALPQLQVCPPDDDAWLELVVGAARTAVAAGDGASSLAPAGTSTTPSEADPDVLGDAVAALRACPPAEAEVLAMGAVANLGREAVSRLTGLEPNAVLALVLQGQQHLQVSLEALIDAMRAPATAAELADLPFAAGLFSSVASVSPSRVVRPVPAGAVTVGAAALSDPALSDPALSDPALSGPALPGPALSAPALTSFGALPQPSVVDIQSLQSTAPANAEQAAPWVRSRSVRVGAGAAAWLLAVGGISTAAAMSGLLSVAVDGILGGRDRGPLVTAEGPIVPGPLPSTEPTPSGTPSPQNPSTGPGTTPTDSTGDDSTGDDSTGTGGDDTVSTPRQPTDVRIVLTSFDVPDPASPATPASPAPGPTPTPTPTTPPVTPPTVVPPTTPPTPRPLVPADQGKGPGNGKGHAKHAGKHQATGHAKQHGKGLATGHAKPAKATDAKAGKATDAKAAKAAAKAAKAKSDAKQVGTASAHTNKGKR